MTTLHRWVGLILVTLTGLSIAAPAPGPAPQHFVTIGTGAVTGVYYPAGGAVCRLLNKDREQHGIRCAVESTAGSIYNLKALREGDLDFGIVQSDWQYHAYHGTGSTFARQGPHKELRAVLSLHAEPFTLVARKETEIRRFEDLRGKRVNIGDPDSGQRGTIEVLLKEKGWELGSFRQVAELKAMEQTKALCDDDIDAITYVVGHPSGIIKEVTASCQVNLVEITGPAVERLISKYPYYRRVQIPGGMYAGNRESVSTFGVGATLVTSAQVPNEVVYRLVKAIFENFAEFQRLHPVFNHLEPSVMVRDGLTAPLHEGARKYYQEVGLLD